jgi:hypothetical protein
VEKKCLHEHLPHVNFHTDPSNISITGFFFGSQISTDIMHLTLLGSFVVRILLIPDIHTSKPMCCTNISVCSASPNLSKVTVSISPVSEYDE